MAGRPRKIIQMSTGKISKAERAEREAAEAKLRISRDELSPPSWLDAAGKKEFRRCVRNFEELNILDNLDLSTLAIYSDAYSHVQSLGKLLRGADAFIEDKEATLRAYEKYTKIVLQCSTKLGLATVDRLKLVTPVKEEKPVNKFIRFLDEEKG